MPHEAGRWVVGTARANEESASQIDRLRILGFEPYDRGSHRAVRETITKRSGHEWRWVTRPGRAWKWRMRLGAVELVDQARASGLLRDRVDVLLATSLLSAADLRAALPAAWRNTPLVLYMHENQAAYPARRRSSAQTERDVHFALTNLTSTLTADLVIWNSRFNFRSFIDGVGRLLRHAPDCRLGRWRQEIEARSVVVWPPVEPPPAGIERRSSSGPTRIVWPHRWEHDKNPHGLLTLARRYSRRCDLRWVILGQQFGVVPPALEALRDELAGRIDHLGFVGRREYWRWLGRSDWVLSTAAHEFFGVAVSEALLAGCLPWLPARLSYPELLPESARGLSPLSPPDDPVEVRAMIRRHLEPALAENAVARLDRVLWQLVEERPLNPPPDPSSPPAG
jgi:hypothetical protein